MKKLYLILLILSFAAITKAQNKDTMVYDCVLLKNKGIKTTGNKDSLSYFDSCPEFPGGNKAYYRFLAKYLKWPKITEDAQGTVFINFIVEKTGKLSNIKIIHGLTPPLNKEALRVIKLSPLWTPAKLRGKPYRCRYTIPIRFKMD